MYGSRSNEMEASSSSSPSSSRTQDGASVRVLYVLRGNAKAVKVSLEKNGLLNKQFRMTQPAADNKQDDSIRDACIAIPVTEECLVGNPMVVATGTQKCPYSSAFLGNHRGKRDCKTLSCSLTAPVQQALATALFKCSPQEPSTQVKNEMMERIMKLRSTVCPKKLEVIGDDRTLVVPHRAFREDDDSFASLLALTQTTDRSKFWEEFAHAMNSPRIVRRGDIHPDSSIRESGHRLLWPYRGQLEQTGPGSAGWITITEQGISQSFDMTRVMFSRGNITEKIRFGKLVQEGEIVLDMYAGIGYYTLPALVHGRAGHVYACEWNQHATDALTYNLSQNHVEARATVLVGDCRQLARDHGLVNMFDRVSLGLLPSSEGGWRTAIKSLRDTTGGWLHVHGNVPDRELYIWRHWMCKTLLGHVDEDERPDDWVVLCVGVERVKSYAPQIHHYVADVFVGPLSSLTITVELEGHRAGILQNNNEFDACLEDIVPPSCALSPDGALHQDWMMDRAWENC